MPYHQPISDKQLAPFLEAAKLMTIPADDVPPLVVEAIPEPYMSQNETILAMHQALIAEVIKTNTNNAKEYEERKELWYCETAIAAGEKAAEEENERAMDVNPEGEDEVDKDETPKSKSKSKSKTKTKSRPIVDSESEEETEEVKAKRRKAKGKGKAVDPEMDANNQIFYVRSKNRCFVCHMRNNVCSFTRDDEADFIMLEAVDNEELQVKLKKLCDEQDTFKALKDKEKAERNKLLGNRPKAGTKKTVQVNAKASGSTPKVVSEEDDIEVTSQLKRVRTVANNDGSNERIPSVAESLHGINKALIVIVDLLGDTRVANEHQAKYLRRIETCMANLQNTMQMHVGQVHYRLGELERRAGIWPVEDEKFANEEFEPVEPEDMEEEVEEVCEEVEEVEEVCEEVEEVCEEVEEVCEEVEEVCEEVEEVCEEVEEVCEEDKEGLEVEDDETMKDPEADEL
ncbi:hypothetical protein M422DRAFT_249662 [Sphaerobolus stellatus SS14]|uniref:Unplaced genomic scaffold SPHSTscaffold_30, whole genome shotgun sequence n=1 Tax=Sphaerobolus stellatus (strain SS14) TaxID=990650 RepID=A0A0C9W406_SPHS4|nr:hypothetical protein M422DRAFT_249662 [Sphaerobolus stellatus SS14]